MATETTLNTLKRYRKYLDEEVDLEEFSKPQVGFTIEEIVNMKTCNNHPSSIPNFNIPISELATSIENLRYDKLQEFLVELAKSLRSRAATDKESGKTKLAFQLACAAADVELAGTRIEKAWEICKPHMEISDE